MGVRVVVSEYLALPVDAAHHALAPAHIEVHADAWVSVRLETGQTLHTARHKPAYTGPLPMWPNLIGREALKVYTQVLPQAAHALRQKAQMRRRYAGLIGIGVGLLVSLCVSRPSRPLFWGMTLLVCAGAVCGAHSATLPYERRDVERLGQLLQVSCLAVRGYLGQFNPGQLPQDSSDRRLDVASRTCLRYLMKAQDTVCQQALRQYQHWALHYRPVFSASTPVTPQAV